MRVEWITDAGVKQSFTLDTGQIHDLSVALADTNNDLLEGLRTSLAAYEDTYYEHVWLPETESSTRMEVAE